MKLKELSSAASAIYYKAAFACKKHAPEALVIAGVVGVVASTVMACKATTKAGDILQDFTDAMDKVHEASDLNVEKYTDEDAKKDTVIVYTQTAVKFIKLYAPAIILGSLSLGCIVSSHYILRKRNAALAAAYTAVDNAFKEYRNRVKERFGEDVDRQIRCNVKAVEVTDTVTDAKGKEKTVTKTVEVPGPINCSPYAKFFDEWCTGWTHDPDYNLMFLRRQQDYANEKLKIQKHLFLNEVYEMLGMQRTKAGQVVGWVFDEDNPMGDNMVDFGIYETKGLSADEIERKVAFVNGMEQSILLDFNVDGNILDSL